MGRFKSVLVEGHSQNPNSAPTDALKVMAAYIDLNPVRAGLTASAADYRWSGWAAALTAEKEAIEGLCDVVGCSVSEWEKGGRSAYHSWVSEQRTSDESECPSIHLLKRMRCFTGGIAVGSAEFIADVFVQWREQFGPKRTTGPRRLVKQNDSHAFTRDLRTLRDLPLNPPSPELKAPPELPKPLRPSAGYRPESAPAK